MSLAVVDNHRGRKGASDVMPQTGYSDKSTVVYAIVTERKRYVLDVADSTTDRGRIEMIERLGEDAKRATFETDNQLKWIKEIL